MCGIAGIIDLDDPPGPERIRAMIAPIAYRGPDGEGEVCFETEGIALGHRRLSILDLSEAGRQPMASEDERFWIVYNGEVYNYLEIRSELEQLGWAFRSHSDTEVLLCAYQQWGRSCLERLMGMYAFAIWDRQERQLFAARDRLGIKPLYYLETSGGLIFASEIKSILAVVPEKPGVDVSLIDAYMEFGYVPGAETLHRGVKRLLPGHTLTWRDRRLAVSSYWNIDFGAQHTESLASSAERVRTMLRDSIALHLRSDVPLGVFLSGGLDSSAVVGLLSKEVSRSLNTFSVAYDFGAEYDETPFAREVAAAFSTNHHEIRVTPKQFMDFVPDFVWHMDEPVTEAAAISLFFVSKLAREHVVVCLSGEGSDELFAGYDFYTYNLAIERLRTIPGAGGLAALAPLLGSARRCRKLAKYLALAGRSLETRYRGISSYDSAVKKRLLTADFARQAAQGNAQCVAFIEELFQRSKGWNTLGRMLYFDTKTWLVDDLLIKADRMSMAASIELRVPFLDHRLVEYAATIPGSFKIRGRSTKFVLKEALRGVLPARIIERKKMGFPTPLEMMFRDDLFGYAEETLLSRRAIERGYFEPDAVRQMLSDHRAGRGPYHREIWQLVVLEEWHRMFGY